MTIETKEDLEKLSKSDFLKGSFQAGSSTSVYPRGHKFHLFIHVVVDCKIDGYNDSRHIYLNPNLKPLWEETFPDLC